MAKKILKLSTPEEGESSTEAVELLRNDDLHKEHKVIKSKAAAEKLLKLQAKKGWKHYTLPENSEYKFENGSLIRKQSERTDSAASAQ